MYKRNFGAYQRSEILTADPMKLVILCYNTAISNLKIAKERISEKQYEAKAIALNKTMDIISELMSSLNFNQGGEVARNLNALYAYMLQRIPYGDASQDISVFDEIISILEQLRDAWKAIEAQRGSEKIPAPVSEPEGLRSAQMVSR
jgi:flagellar protein FliS